MSTGTIRETPDVAAGVCRMIRALGKRVAAGDPNELALLLDLQTEVATALELAVRTQRGNGHSDGDIGRSLGVTRQAVSKRWPGDGRYRGAAGRHRRFSAP